MKGKIMKNVILATILFTTATPVLADSVNSRIKDHFKYVVQTVPETRNFCEIVEVPIYGRAQASTSDTVVGAIIGGAVGNQFGGGSGKDAMTVLGAIVGADIANKQGSKQIIGYEQQQKCYNETVYVDVEQSVYSHSTITFKSNGKTYTLQFQK
jgi:uncharacterized protein YcfJ